MKNGIVFICVLMVLFRSELRAEKWQSLFNGETLEGWQVMDGTAEFKVENGAIVGIYRTNTPNTFLAHEGIYGDFILEYEAKLDSGLNSGVQIRSRSLPEYKNGRVHGYQVEIATRGRFGHIYDEARRGRFLSEERADGP